MSSRKGYWPIRKWRDRSDRIDLELNLRAHHQGAVKSETRSRARAHRANARACAAHNCVDIHIAEVIVAHYECGCSRRRCRRERVGLLVNAGRTSNKRD